LSKKGISSPLEILILRPYIYRAKALIAHLNIAIMRIRVKNGIVAKQQPENLVVVEFTPLVAGEYDAQLIDHEFVEITKPNGKAAFLSQERFANLIAAGELLVLKK
jgi:hypothetical protein